MQELQNEQTESLTSEKENEGGKMSNEGNTSEQVAYSTPRTEEVKKVSLGKFKDIDSLLSAYNSLQAEFTKRCQRIKELESAKTVVDKAEVPTTEKEEILNNNQADTSLKEEFDKEEILKDYLKKVMGSKQKAVVMESEGAGIKTLVSRPKTIEQAGNLAMELLAKNK